MIPCLDGFLLNHPVSRSPGDGNPWGSFTLSRPRDAIGRRKNRQPDNVHQDHPAKVRQKLRSAPGNSQVCQPAGQSPLSQRQATAPQFRTHNWACAFRRNESTRNRPAAIRRNRPAHAVEGALVGGAGQNSRYRDGACKPPVTTAGVWNVWPGGTPHPPSRMWPMADGIRERTPASHPDQV